MTRRAPKPIGLGGILGLAAVAALATRYPEGCADAIDAVFAPVGEWVAQRLARGSAA